MKIAQTWRVEILGRTMIFAATLACLSCGPAGVSLPNPPVVRSHDGLAAVTLTAVSRHDGRETFVFEQSDTPPTIRVAPGDTLTIHYVNSLPTAIDAAARRGK